MTAPMQSHTTDKISHEVKKETSNLEDKNVYQRDHEGKNALFFAIEAKKIDQVMFLVENESSLMVTRKKHALFHAVSCNHFESVRYLLKKGIYVDIRNGSGQTALIYAARYGRLNIACLLISFGADLCAMDNKHDMAIDLVREGSKLRSILDLKMS